MFFIYEHFSIAEIKMVKNLVVTFRNFAKATKTFSDKGVDKIKIHILSSLPFFSKIVPFLR